MWPVSVAAERILAACSNTKYTSALGFRGTRDSMESFSSGFVRQVSIVGQYARPLPPNPKTSHSSRVRRRRQKQVCVRACDVDQSVHPELRRGLAHRQLSVVDFASSLTALSTRVLLKSSPIGSVSRAAIFAGFSRSIWAHLHWRLHTLSACISRSVLLTKRDYR